MKPTEPQKNPFHFLTVDDWAARLQVSKRTIFRMIDDKIIPPYDFSTGKTRRWRVETYDAWVADLGSN